MAAIYSLYIINKSGGLIFYKVNERNRAKKFHWFQSYKQDTKTNWEYGLYLWFGL